MVFALFIDLLTDKLQLLFQANLATRPKADEVAFVETDEFRNEAVEFTCPGAQTLLWPGVLAKLSVDHMDFHHVPSGSVVYVKLVFVIHVGGTRCVPSSTDNIVKIHARITLTVEFIRGYIFLFLFYV